MVRLEFQSTPKASPYEVFVFGAIPWHIRHPISNPLEAICLKAVATRAQDRYETPINLAEDVEH